MAPRFLFGRMHTDLPCAEQAGSVSQLLLRLLAEFSYVIHYTARSGH
jgi:hypothetical protein